MRKCWMALLLCCLLALTGCGARETQEAEDGRLQIVTTVFPAYDFARAAAGELADVRLLLPPGTESHSYEPTPADILAVQECDLFIYLGGESDAWVETILAAADRQGTDLRMLDCVDLLEEETTEGMETEEHDHGPGDVVEMDEHVWTSPKNAAAITRAVGAALGQVDPAHGEDFTAGAEDYAGELEALDREFADFFTSRPDGVLVFGDRFPLRYFAAEYGVEYYAAFPGCSTQTEPSAATVAFLTELVRDREVSTVWYIEFSNHLVADSIAEAAGAETAMFHTCHNVTQAEMDGGATYLSLMQGNLETLRAHF